MRYRDCRQGVKEENFQNINKSKSGINYINLECIGDTFMWDTCYPDLAVYDLPCEG